MRQRDFSERQNRVMDGLEKWVLWPPVVICGTACFIAVYALAASCLQWLATGAFPDYDLFFLLADVKCDATGGVAKGFEGMLLCREEFTLTSLVGLNSILTAVLDLHLGFSALVVGVLALFFWMLIIELVLTVVVWLAR